MRVSQKLVIAIFGRSCTGKSTVAKILAEKHSLRRRHCGDVAQRAAADLGVDVSDLSEDCHRKIDSETVEWICKTTGFCLVEGRYLDQVLAPVAPALILVRFEASLQTRAVRWHQKDQQGPYTVTDIKRLDSEDDAFHKRMYKGRPGLRPAITMDTTSLTPEEIANWLIYKTRATKIERD